ncbi:hypothetical protein EV1_043179 [Malus domestica]
MHYQRSLSSYSVFLIPWSISANKPSRAKVFHIMKVESKSISYHAFFMSFSLSLLSPLPDCLPSLALEYSSSTVGVLLEKMPHPQVKQVKMIPQSMWRQRANSSSTKQRITCHASIKSKSISYHQSRRQRYLMACFSFTLALTYRTKEKESNRRALGKTEQRNRPSPLPSVCLPYRRIKQRRTQQKESELNPRAREVSTTF